MSLHITDPYSNIPSFDEVINFNKEFTVDYTTRSIYDLDIISGVQSTQINNAMSSILRTMDKVGMVNQRGFEILIQILSLKIYDEKRNEGTRSINLDFYITKEEKIYNQITDDNLQKFLNRILDLINNASGAYYRIFSNMTLNLKNESHVRILIEIVAQFQHYSFCLSHKTDLYQLVFYKFAAPFSKDQNAQFVTPLPIIDFLVQIVNPRNGETVIDPTVGIADFLSVSYVNSQSKLNDNNIYGMDIDEQMVMLATLNMLLNGDGNAKIKARSGHGSLLSKFSHTGEVIDLIPSVNKKGNWDERTDDEQIKKFDVVLTNPPFGDDRAFQPDDKKDKEIIECYELWHLYNPEDDTKKKDSTKTKKVKEKKSKIDLGVIFLENACRILNTNGRLGIVVSNSIASIDTHKVARKWLMEKMRIVAIFDLPPNVFAETGVNTSIIVAYKPNDVTLEKLKNQNYEVYFKNIDKVGYEVKTSKRVKYFSPVYKIDYNDFNIMVDENGNSVIDEEFTTTIKEFKQWCLTQEKQLQDIFVKSKIRWNINILKHLA